MRSRERVVQSLENVYRGAFGAAEKVGDTAAMARLDLEYQRDQLHLEVLLDIRDLLTPEQPDKTSSLIEKAQQIRQLTKLRP
jgi:Spy/CpxP family protein refolding chaperone